jgi:two-component system, OmpR family, response regulator
MRILLVEDNEDIVEVLSRVLAEQNYTIDIALDGETGWELVESYPYDLVLLDVCLPKLDGIHFCRRLRERNNPVLVMLLTARESITDKLIGLNSGADDYVVKPFNVQELVARIRALLRRTSSTPASILTCHELCLNTNTREVTYAGKKLRFSRKEYLIVELFLRNQQRVFSRSAIVDHVWSFSEEPPDEATVKSHIKNIRRELKAVGAIDLIETVYGQGYRINPVYLQQPKLLDETEAEKEQSLDARLTDIWQRTSQTSLAKVSFLEATTRSLQSGTCDQTQLGQAITTAHKLAGTLGTFGFDLGSQIAQQIEDLLQAKSQATIAPPNEPQWLQHLAQLVESLRRELTEESNQPAKIKQSTGSTLPIGSQPQPNPSATKVLAVDDDPQILAVIEAILKQAGMQIACLNDPTQFWQVLASVQPDLLILDVNMPTVSGLDLCRAVRDRLDWNWLPILFLTVRTDQETVQQIFAFGADDYVTKPIFSDELLTRVTNRLQRSASLKRYSELNITRLFHF